MYSSSTNSCFCTNGGVNAPKCNRWCANNAINPPSCDRCPDNHTDIVCPPGLPPEISKSENSSRLGTTSSQGSVCTQDRGPVIVECPTRELKSFFSLPLSRFSPSPAMRSSQIRPSQTCTLFHNRCSLIPDQSYSPDRLRETKSQPDHFRRMIIFAPMIRGRNLDGSASRNCFGLKISINAKQS